MQKAILKICYNYNPLRYIIKNFRNIDQLALKNLHHMIPYKESVINLIYFKNDFFIHSSLYVLLKFKIIFGIQSICGRITLMQQSKSRSIVKKSNIISCVRFNIIILYNYVHHSVAFILISRKLLQANKLHKVHSLSKFFYLGPLSFPCPFSCLINPIYLTIIILQI